jgi:hypothetical protein
LPESHDFLNRPVAGRRGHYIACSTVNKRAIHFLHLAYHPSIMEPGFANSKSPAPSSPRWLDLSEDALLEDCRFEAFRGPGPGGQKRNKTSNTIRLTHLATGIHVISGESRSQAENKLRAIRRLKLRLAAEVRHAIDPRGFEPPPWFASVVQAGRLAASHRHPQHARAAALILDLIESRRGSVGDAAKLLGVSTSSVVHFLEAEHELWTAANSIRKRAGQTPLRKR